MTTTSHMAGRTCMVTGANSGIGRETALALAGMGGHVVAVCRDRQRGETALRGADGRIDLMIADLSSQASIRALAKEFLASYPALHVLVNNAGAMHVSRSETVDSLETTFATNHLGYFLLTDLLLDLIKRSAPARIVNVSSGAHLRGQIDFDDLNATRGYSVMRAYSQSKLANVLFTTELASRLEGTGVTANALHPGVVRTGFGKNGRGVVGSAVAGLMRVAGVFFLSPRTGAETSIYLASSPEVEGVTGKYFFKCREAPTSAAAQDAEAARRLWEVSAELTGVAAERTAS